MRSFESNQLKQKSNFIQSHFEARNVIAKCRGAFCAHRSGGKFYLLISYIVSGCHMLLFLSSQKRLKNVIIGTVTISSMDGRWWYKISLELSAALTSDLV